MTTQSWTLIDTENGIHEAAWNREIAPGVTVDKKVWQGGKRQGVDSVKIESRDFTFEVLPTRGMNIWKIRSGEMEYGWKSPARGPVHPQWVPLMEPGGLGWLDGFDEVFVRCGLESNGAPEHDPETGVLKYPLHGRIGNLPAHHVSVSLEDDVVKVTGVVDEARFHFMKMRMTSTLSWKIGTHTLKVEDQIENLSASPHEIQMLYHINFGIPLLDAGSQFVAPVKTVVPRNEHAGQAVASWSSYAAPTPGFAEQVYFLELAADADGDTLTLLKNAHGTAGVAIDYNIRQLPCFTLWKNTTSIEDGYVTGLEPGTNFPNPRSFEGEQKRFIPLEGHQKVNLGVAMEFLTNEQAVANVEKQIRKLAPSETQLFDSPQAGWCAD